MAHELNSSIINDDNVESYILIWLDTSVNCESHKEIRFKLQSLINYLQLFENIVQCESHLQTTVSNDRIILVTHDDFAEELIHKIHFLPQLFSIYIYSTNKQFQHEWIQQYYKIKGIFKNFDHLIDQIQVDQFRRRHERCNEQISISIYDQNDEYEQSTIGLDGRFLHSQLIISCLLRMKSTSNDKNEFISKYRGEFKEDQNYLKILDEFEKEYSPDYSLRWYTRETFLYRLLNKALRAQDIDTLFLFRFFIHDLDEQLNRRRYLNPIRVYRGQLMSTDELNILKKLTGKFISVNSFFSTSSNRAMALAYLGSHNVYESLHRILFEIDADPSKENVKSFADLSSLSYFPEDEFLMALGSIFCIEKVYLGENQIWFIEMILCSNNDGDLQHMISHMLQQYNQNNMGLILLGNHLIDMGNFNDAEKYLCRLLEQLSTKDKDIYKCYHALSKVSYENGNYHLCIDYLEKALKVLQNNEDKNCGLGYIYNSMGEVYQKLGDLSRALEFYQIALKKFSEKFNNDDENIAWCFNNIGNVYVDLELYHIARDYLLQAFHIKEKILPAQHDCLGNTYNNLGNIHYYLQEYDQALEKYKLCYEIFRKSLTSRHPSIARILRNIGIVYEAKQDYETAMKYYQQTAAIREKTMLTTHPDLIEIKNDIKRILYKLQQIKQ
ncbi:hypothetical protein I4U23_016179 [Adineta vaga]|nr:hypothetical protein I4U23_016179 [Adineta vaga]